MGARGRRHVLAAVAVALTVGCAARLGPVELAVGDARVTTCGPAAEPTCHNETRGGHLGAVFGQLWDSTVGAAARVFGAAAPPTVVVAPIPAPAEAD